MWKMVVICIISGFILGAAVLPGEDIVITTFSDKTRPVIVIDPGHGGFDGGAEGIDGTLEKDLNLQVAKALNEVASLYPVEIVMTRTDDIALGSTKKEDMKKRKEIIEESGAQLAVLIHMNSFKEDESVCGVQVFYAGESDDLEEERTEEQVNEHNSFTYAQNVHEWLEFKVPDGKEREIQYKNNVYLMKNTNVNTILVECGFLSNAQELERLKTLEYQQIIADAIWNGINEILCLERIKKVTLIDSKNIPGKE